MLRPIYAAVFAGLVTCLTTSLTEACSCPQTTPQELLEDSDAVYAGTVIEVRDWEDGYYIQVEFEASVYWKGDARPKQTLLIEPPSSSCGYSFVVGTEYLIFAVQHPTIEGELWATSCRRIQRLSNADRTLEALGPGQSVPALPVSWGLVKARY